MEADAKERGEPRLLASDFYGYLKPSRCGLRVWLREQGVEEDPPSAFSRDADAPRDRARAPPPRAVPAGTSTSASCRATSSGRRRSQRSSGERRVIYQGRMHGTATLAGREIEIVGVPDFLLPARRGYAIRDSKLNRRVGPSQAHVRLQLEIYGWLYEQTFGEPPVALQVHAGQRRDPRRRVRGRRPRRSRPLEEILALPAQRRGAGRARRGGQVRRLRLPLALLAAGRGAAGRRAAAVGRPGPGRRAPRAAASHTLRELLERFDAERLAAVERHLGRRAEAGRRSRRPAAGQRAGAARGPPDRARAARDPRAPDTYVMFDLEGISAELDELEKIYLWGMQVFGERRRRVPRRRRRLRPSGRPRGLGVVPARGGRDLRRARRHPLRPLGDLRAGEDQPLPRALRRPRRHRRSASTTTCSTCCRSPTSRSPCRSRATASRRSRRSPATSASSRSPAASGRWPATSRRPRPTTRRARRDHGRDPRLQPRGPGGDLGGDGVAAAVSARLTRPSTPKGQPPQ